MDAKGSPEAWGSPIVGTVKREIEARRSADRSDMNVLDGRRDRSERVARRDGVSRSVGKKVGKNDLHNYEKLNQDVWAWLYVYVVMLVLRVIAGVVHNSGRIVTNQDHLIH